MKLKRHLAQAQGFSSLLFVPLVNLLLLILIFVLVNPAGVPPSGVQLDLPRLATSGMLSAGISEILVAADDTAYWDHQPVTVLQLQSALRKIAARKEAVIIKADARASLGALARVCDLARAQGVTQVYVATD